MTAFIPSITVIEGDCGTELASLHDASVNCCITSPPYWGLRDYGVAGQLGLEPTPTEYVERMVAVFREVRRVLRDDGVLWLNLGDCYAAGGQNAGSTPEQLTEKQRSNRGCRFDARKAPAGYKPKDLVGIPWMVAFALRADGWYLRSDVIWHKPNPMPESVTDRPTKAHEYLFLLAKSEQYYYDADAIREPHSSAPVGVDLVPWSATTQEQTEREGRPGHRDSIGVANRPPGYYGNVAGRNRRTVWTVATQPYSGAHFATFPPKLIEPCVLAGCPEGGMILDPFGGAGTVGLVALRHRRSATLIELNPTYCELISNRCDAVQQNMPLSGVYKP